jgi:hypothetical protein
LTLVACMVQLAAKASEPASKPVEVMMIGAFHMNN